MRIIKLHPHWLLLAGFVVVVAIGAAWLIAANRPVGSSGNLAGTHTPKPLPTGQGLLTGTVRVGPTSPVCSTAQPCDKAAGSTTVVVKDGQGRVIKQVQSDENGKFKIQLPEGDYTVSAESSSGIGRSSSTITVHLSGGGTSNIQISIDTGIR